MTFLRSLGKKGVCEGEALLHPPPPHYTADFWTNFGRRRERFFFLTDIYFMLPPMEKLRGGDRGKVVIQRQGDRSGERGGGG